MNGKPSPKGDSTLLVLRYQPLGRSGAQGGQSNHQSTGPFQPSGAAPSRTNLFVKNLPLGITEAQLAQLFSRFGPVRSLRIKRPDGVDARNVFTTAYAISYVNFEKEEDATKALVEMNGQTYLNHQLQIGYYDKSQQQHVFVSAADVVQSENLKGLFVKGL
jgi:RNA recognition motif-containing protein